MVYKKSSPRPSAIRHMPCARLRQGFTLIEILVVISIIVLLTAIGAVVLPRAQEQARDAKRISDLNNLSSALENFYADQRTLPGSGGTIYTSDFAPSGNFGSCDGTGWIYGVDLCPYISVLPFDPSATAILRYRYTFVGAVYELDAGIEVLTDEAAGDGGNDNLRYEVGTGLTLL